MRRQTQRTHTNTHILYAVVQYAMINTSNHLSMHMHNNLPLECGGAAEAGAGSAEDVLSSIVASVDAGLEVLALDVAGHEATGKGITSTVGVNNLGGLELGDGEALDLVADSDDDVLGTPGDNSGTGAATDAVNLGGDVLGDGLEVGLLPLKGLGDSLGLDLVAKDNVGVDDDLQKRLRKELANEGGREGKSKVLLVGGSMLSNGEHSRDGNGKEVALNDVVGSVGPDGLDVLLVKVLGLVLVGSSEAGNHGAVLLLDEAGASAGGDGGINHVADVHTIALGALAEGNSVGIITDATSIGRSTSLLEHPLSDADSVLARTTGDVLGGVRSLNNGLEKTLVLLLSENGVGALETVPRYQTTK